MASSMMQSLGRGFEYAFVKAIADIKAEHGRYYLGLLWWICEPLLQVATLYVIFGIFLQRQRPDFVSFLLIGIVLWKGIAAVVQHAGPTIGQHRDVLLHTGLPEWVFPTAVGISDGIKFCGLFFVLLLFLGTQGHVSHAWLYLPVLLICFFVFSAGVSLFVSSLLPLLPDLRFVIDCLLQLGFWAAGIFYAVDELPVALQGYFYWNPSACIIMAFRDVLLYGRLPDAVLLIYPFATGLSCIVCALWIMKLLRGEYVKL